MASNPSTKICKSIAETVIAEWSYELNINKSKSVLHKYKKSRKKKYQTLMVDKIRNSAKTLSVPVSELSNDVIQNNIESEFKDFIQGIPGMHYPISTHPYINTIGIQDTAHEVLYKNNKPSIFFQSLIKQIKKREKNKNYISTF